MTRRHRPLRPIDEEIGASDRQEVARPLNAFVSALLRTRLPKLANRKGGESAVASGTIRKSLSGAATPIWIDLPIFISVRKRLAAYALPDLLPKPGIGSGRARLQLLRCPMTVLRRTATSTEASRDPPRRTFGTVVSAQRGRPALEGRISH